MWPDALPCSHFLTKKQKSYWVCQAEIASVSYNSTCKVEVLQLRGGQYFWVLRIGRDLGYHLASVLSLTRWKISVGTLSGLAKVTEVHGRVNEIRTLQLLEVKNVSVKSKRGFLHLAFLTCRKNVVPYFTEERPEARREKPFESQTIRVTWRGHGTVYPQTQDSWCSPVSLTQPFPDHSDDTN